MDTNVLIYLLLMTTDDKMLHQTSKTHYFLHTVKIRFFIVCSILFLLLRLFLIFW